MERQQVSISHKIPIHSIKHGNRSVPFNSKPSQFNMDFFYTNTSKHGFQVNFFLRGLFDAWVLGNLLGVLRTCEHYPPKKEYTTRPYTWKKYVFLWTPVRICFQVSSAIHCMRLLFFYKMFNIETFSFSYFPFIFFRGYLNNFQQ